MPQVSWGNDSWGAGGGVVALLRQVNPKEINCGVVSGTLIVVALLCQLHPAVQEGVILAVLDSIIVLDLVLHGVGVDCFKGGPQAMLVEGNLLRGPPIETACVGNHLVALYCLHQVAVCNDTAVAWGELSTHHTTEVLL